MYVQVNMCNILRKIARKAWTIAFSNRGSERVR